MIKNEIRPLTGIRALAAMWVVCLHFEPDIIVVFPSLALLHPLFDEGTLGVDIFFVLSGFVLSMVYKIETFNFKWIKYKGFLVNRLARIYPDYLFCFFLLALMIAADHLLGRKSTDLVNYPISSAGWHLAMMQAWPLVPATWSNWNAPAWSVSAEWFAYLLLFPFAKWLISKSVVKRFSPVFALIILALFVPFAHSSDELYGFYFVFRITSLFLTGCLMYAFCLTSPSTAQKLANHLDVIVVGFTATIWFGAHTTIGYWLIMLAIPVIIVGLTRESSKFAKLLSTPFFCYLGHISYALYLVHAIAQRMLHVMLPVEKYASGPFYLKLIVLLSYLMFPILLAAGIYHLVEEPSRLAIRRRFNS